MIHETYKPDIENDSDKVQSEPVTFTAKAINARLELGRKLGNHFLQCETNIEHFQRDIDILCLSQYEEKKKLIVHESDDSE
ncbi:unnamed protein product [Euphydryas editha]|uniref:Uncharacterized protein n=1 Tax=Euphydryas editha TaxID=104508 RepID=A0AAU9V8R8_EUPED|nr:unnamed protein product [Euphydryas editha]